MKRIITLAIVSIFLFAFKCNDTSSEKQKKQGPSAAALAACSDALIVINKDNFDQDPASDEFTKWESINQQYYCDAPVTSAECANYVVIDLFKISTTNDVKVAKWLKANTDYICYDASYGSIEKKHEITDVALKNKVTAAISAGEDTSMSFKDFIGLIKYYDDFNYEMYLNFTIDASKKISFKPVNKYVKGMRSFSLPSIKSVVSVNKIPEADFYKYLIRFVEIENSTGEKVIAFRLDKGSSVVKYYDYSTNPGHPPSITTVMIYNNFL